MGGYGSGQHMRTRRTTTEQARWISADEFARIGLVTPNQRQTAVFEWPVCGVWPSGGRGTVSIYAPNASRATAQLTYTAGGVAHAIEDEITLHSTPQPFGGVRWWFACPACGRRSGKLYLPSTSLRFRCRPCHNLAYQCQRESLPERWERRADKIVERLGGEAADGLVYKPRWMRWATFHRLMDEVQENDEAAMGYRVRGLFKPHSWLTRAVYGRRR